MIRILFDASTVQLRIAALAAEVAADYPAGDIVFLGILTGAADFMMRLIGSLPGRMRARVVYDFVDVSSYAGQAGTGDVHWRRDCGVELRDRDVVVVDGVVDSGLTLHHVLKRVAELRPRSVRVCALVDKPTRRTYPVPVDYSGFTAADVFLVGCGMDCDQRYRALDYVGVLEAHESLPAAGEPGGKS